MALSSPPVSVAALDDGFLNAGISASATTITVTPIYKTIAGVRTKQGFNSTSGICLIRLGNSIERISFESSSVNSTTNVTTLSTVTRGLSLTATTPTYGSGTGIVWPKGARITVVNDASYLQAGVFTNVGNTFTANQTITGNLDVSGRIRQTGTSGALEPPQVTSSQRDALASQRGIVDNTTSGQMEAYVGGVWSGMVSGTIANASTTVAGKIELATAAERAAGTATGGTGATLVPTNDALVKTSSGAGDENKLPVLGSSGTIALGHLGSGTPAASKYVDGGTGAWTSLATSGSTVSLQVRYQVTAGISTASTTFVDMDGTNMTTTVATTTANTILVVLVSGSAMNATSSNIYFDILSNGARLGNATSGLLGTQTTASSAANYAVTLLHIYKPGAGSNIVVKPQWRTSAGTANFAANSIDCTFSVLKIEP